MDVTREQALRYRWRAQGLGRSAGSVPLTQVEVLDLGVQDGANDAARVSLVNRGVTVEAATRALDGFGEDVALVWSIRGAPHLYRRADLPDVATATSPLGEADAAKRVVSAGKALHDAGVDVLDALAEIGRRQREALAAPLSKGELSARLRESLPAAYLTACRPCGCAHCHEMTFRLAPLFAGLELEPGTSPPVLRRVPGWPPDRALGPATDPTRAPERLQPVRAYLHFLGPATPRDVAAYLEAPVAAVRAAWPTDVAQVSRAGTTAWVLAEDAGDLAAAAAAGDHDEVRLLSAFDLFTAAKDRRLLTDDKARHQELWPVLGRPGALAADGELLGTWRPKSVRGALTVRLRPWRQLDRSTTAAVRFAAEALAHSRGQELAGVSEE